MISNVVVKKKRTEATCTEVIQTTTNKTVFIWNNRTQREREKR